jgi:AcrR family transcriptional regulator
MNVNDNEPHRRTQAERTAQTRRVLLDSARELFTEKGYAGVAAEQIVERAGVTRGALYHHFSGKAGLFRAVLEELEDEVDRLVMDAPGEPSDPWPYVLGGFKAFLEACARPDVRQIMLVDGPSVLGWHEWHELDVRHALKAIEFALNVLVGEGLIPAQPLRPLAQLLHGAVIEAALFVASADSPEAAVEETWAALRHLLEGLREGKGT